MPKRTSNKEHWERLWKKRPVKEIYDNSGRVLEAVKRRTMETGLPARRVVYDVLAQLCVAEAEGEAGKPFANLASLLICSPRLTPRTIGP